MSFDIWILSFDIFLPRTSKLFPTATLPFDFSQGREPVEWPFGFAQGHEPVEWPFGFAQGHEPVEWQMMP
jgi:hypothetical protein